uniref:Uncharacterized protein n=1 Tax=Oryza meridionalis TaxID=40149 RepID=A0A0E0CMH4_9ORYZ
MDVLPSSTAGDGGRQAGSQRRRRASDCFLLGWEPPFGCLGVLAGIGAAGTNVYGVVHLHAFAMASCCRGSYQVMAAQVLKDETWPGSMG